MNRDPVPGAFALYRDARAHQRWIVYLLRHTPMTLAQQAAWGRQYTWAREAERRAYCRWKGLPPPLPTTADF